MLMSNNSTAANYVSIERVDSTKGYEPDNVCLIRADVNSIKGLVLDLAEKGVQSSTKVDNIMLAKMCATVFDPAKIQAIKDKYKKMFDNLSKEEDTTPIEGNDTSQEGQPMPQSNNPTNPELYLSQKYYTFGNQIESLGEAFNITYGEFKRMVNRRYCQLTDRPLTPHTAALWVIDKTSPVCKNNVLVVDSGLCIALDNFMVQGGMSLFEMKKMCKNLLGKGGL